MPLRFVTVLRNAAVLVCHFFFAPMYFFSMWRRSIPMSFFTVTTAESIWSFWKPVQTTLTSPMMSVRKWSDARYLKSVKRSRCL